MTLVDVRGEIERRFAAHPEVGNYNQSPTGEPYVVIGHQSRGCPEVAGTIEEGAVGENVVDEEFAYLDAMSAFNEYADGRCGTLYWRVHPRLEWNEAHNRCRIYSRLLISDKPQIQSAQIPPRAA